MLEPNKFPAIDILSMRISPSAIARLVIASTINAIKRAADRAFAHVGKKISEISPTLSDANASATITAVVLILSVVAAPHHTGPLLVSEALPRSCSVTMSEVNASGVTEFTLITTARNCIAAGQFVSSNRFDSTAVAMTHKTPLRFAVGNVLANNDEPAKSAANHSVNYT